MNPIDRRRALACLGTTLLIPSALVGCGKKSFVCTDTAGLAPDEAAARNTLGYVDQSTDATKPCSACSLYKAASEGQCGGCQILKGPIHPQGTCKSWVKKA